MEIDMAGVTNEWVKNLADVDSFAKRFFDAWPRPL